MLEKAKTLQDKEAIEKLTGLKIYMKKKEREYYEKLVFPEDSSVNAD